MKSPIKSAMDLGEADVAALLAQVFAPSPHRHHGELTYVRRGGRVYFNHTFVSMSEETFAAFQRSAGQPKENTHAS